MLLLLSLDFFPKKIIIITALFSLMVSINQLMFMFSNAIIMMMMMLESLLYMCNFIAVTIIVIIVCTYDLISIPKIIIITAHFSHCWSV